MGARMLWANMLDEKRTQERGRLRRGELVAATRSLLRTRDVDEISLTDIASAAGIPKSSAYHLFATVFDVYVAAAQDIEAELHDHMQLLSVAESECWQILVERFIRHGATFFNAQPDAMQLLLGPKSPPAIKLFDREQSDTALGEQLMRRLDSQFQLPQWPSRTETFFHAIEIADLFFSLSVVRHRTIIEEMEVEAVRAVNAYLSLYLPYILPWSHTHEQD